MKNPLNFIGVMKKFTLVLLGLIVFGFLLGAILFEVKKDDFKQMLKMELNNTIDGTIDFAEIEVSLFKHFPQISITFSDLVFENNQRINNKDWQQNLLNFKKINAQFEPFNVLLNHQLVLSGIKIKGGNSTVRIYRPVEEEKVTELKEKTKTTTASPVENELSIDVSDILIQNTNLLFQNDIAHFQFTLSLNELQLLKSLQSKNQLLTINSDLNLSRFILNGREIPGSFPIKTELNGNLFSESMQFHINKGLMVIENTDISFNGEIGFGEKENLDITFHANDKGFNLSKLILTESGIKNFKKGDISVDGKLTRTESNSALNARFELSANDIEIDIPTYNSEIKDLNFHVQYDMGTKADMSESIIIIDTLYGKLPGGEIYGNAKVVNLIKPSIDANIHLESDLQKLFSIIDVSPFKLNNGHTSIQLYCDDLKFNPANPWPSLNQLNASLQLNNLSGQYGDEIQFSKLATNLRLSAIRKKNFNKSAVAKKMIGIEINPEYRIQISGKAMVEAEIYLDKLKSYNSDDNRLKGAILGSLLIKKIDINTNNNKFILQDENVHIQLNDVSWHAKDVCEIDSANGRLSFHHNTLFIEQLTGKMLSSDFEIKGKTISSEEVMAPNNSFSSEFELKSDFVNASELYEFYQDDTLTESTVKNLKVLISIPNLRWKEQDLLIKYSDLVGDYNLLNSPISIPYGTVTIKQTENSIHISTKNEKIFFNTGSGRLSTSLLLKEEGPSHAKITLGLSDVNTSIFSGVDEQNIISVDVGTSFDYEYDTLFSLSSATLSINSLMFNSPEQNWSVGELNLIIPKLEYHTPISANNFLQFSTKINGTLNDLAFKSYKVANVDMDISAHKGDIKIQPKHLDPQDFNIPDSLNIKINEENFTVHYSKEVHDLNYKYLLKNYEFNKFIEGNIDLKINMFYTSSESESAFQNIHGSILTTGTNMNFYGIDFDQIIKRYENSKKYNLAGMGTLFFLGPLAIKYKEVEKYNDLLKRKKVDRTEIRSFRSQLEVNRGIIDLKDVAFSTNKYRFATKGTYNFIEDKLDISSAIVDQRGCSMLDQTIRGNSKSYQMGKASLKEFRKNPVMDRYENFKKKNCVPFYSGLVKAPLKKN